MISNLAFFLLVCLHGHGSMAKVGKHSAKHGRVRFREGGEGQGLTHELGGPSFVCLSWEGTERGDGGELAERLVPPLHIPARREEEAGENRPSPPSLINPKIYISKGQTMYNSTKPNEIKCGQTS